MEPMRRGHRSTWAGAITLALLAVSATLAAGPAAGEPVRGNLLVIGGGKIPPALLARFVELAGGRDARIAVIPMASEEWKKAGKDYEKRFKEAGAAEVRSFAIRHPASANDEQLAAELRACTGFFFGGGDQNKLTRLLLGTKALEAIRQRWREGAAVGGTSAGAAVMSGVMITGDGDWTSLRRDTVQTAEGFGFLPGVIVDQHFVKRARFNRLLSLCLQLRRPGIGIDESTALWVRPGGVAEVVGLSTVLVVDPRGAEFSAGEGALPAARGVRLDVLRPGDTLQLPAEAP